jgi:hypothetical protein
VYHLRYDLCLSYDQDLSLHPKSFLIVMTLSFHHLSPLSVTERIGRKMKGGLSSIAHNSPLSTLSLASHLC